MRRYGTKRSLRIVAQVLTVGVLAFGLACSSTMSGETGKEGAETRPQVEGAPQGTQLESYLAEARRQLEAGNHDQALRAVDQAYALDKNNRDVIKLRSQIKAEQEKAVAEQGGRKIEEQLERAQSLYNAEKYDEAIVAYREILKQDPENRTAKKYLDRSQSALNDLKRDEAAKAERAQQEQAKAAVQQQLAAAKRLYEAKQYDNAIAAYREVQKLDPNNREAQRYIERAQNALNEQKKMAMAEQARSAESALKASLSNADNLMKQAKYDEAIAAYQEVLKTDPNNSTAKKGITKANEKIADAKKKQSSDLIDLAKANIKEKRYDAALLQLEQAKQVQPDNKQIDSLMADARRAKADAARTVEAPKEVAQATDTKKAEEEAKKAEADRIAQARREEEARKRADSEKQAEADRKAEETKQAEQAAATDRELRERERREAERTARAEREAAERREREDARRREQEKQAEPMRPTQVQETAAPTPAPVSDRDARRAADAQYDQALNRARSLADAGNYEAAIAAYDEMIQQFPDRANSLTRSRDRLVEQQTTATTEAQTSTARAQTKAAQQAFEQGVQEYQKNPDDLDSLQRARDLWLNALELDPEHSRARVYLEDTEAKFNQLLSERQRGLDFQRREAEALQKMETPIPIDTFEPTALSEILRTLKLLSGIDFVLMGGADTRIEAAFSDKPLREVLDSMLLPIGLKWERKPGSDTVVIVPDLKTSVFRVSPDKLRTVDALLQQGTIQEILWGADGQPDMEGQKIYTDARQNIVVATDSAINLQKLSSLLAEIGQQAVDLEFASYTIQEDKAPQIKALLDAILRTDDEAPYNPERKLIIEGNELIIKDTPENIRRVEEILKDRAFLAKIYSQELQVATFNLTPILDIQDNPDLAHKFGEDVRSVVETLLYAQEGRAKSNAEGRRLWYDEATLQLIVTDYPHRIKAVEEFIASLPQIQRKKRSQIRFLNWATASEISSQVDTFLGGGTSRDSGASGENEVVKTLRTEGEFEFQGAYFRVVRVNENDAADENDDNVELIARAGDQSDEITIEEFRLENILGGEYTIVAEDIRPSTTPGEGRAKLRFIYNPGQTQQVQPEEVEEEPRERLFDVILEPIDNLNAVWIQYDNAKDLDEVLFWIDTLDRPTLQVSLEIKFVEVVEQKARQLKADFQIGNLADGVSLSDSIVRNRFAQDVDEFDSPFETLTESPQAANLLKGASVTNWIVNNGQSPISLTLRALEAQGVINVVNAPSITVLNGETANFSITRFFPVISFGAVGSNTTTGQTGTGQTGTGQTGTGNTGTQTGNNQNQTGSQQGISLNEIRYVDNLEVTPSVTQAGNITLSPIEVVIQDQDNNLGTFQQLTAVTPTTGNILPTRQGITNNGVYSRLEKDIETHARIRDGGTVVLGGWKNERVEDLESGVPVLKDIPFIGAFLFNRSQQTSERVTLLIFLTGSVVRD